jgi:uncharacterized protein (DUF1330 family)
VSAYLVVGLQATTDPPADAAERGAAYFAGAVAAMTRLGTTMSLLAMSDRVVEIAGRWEFGSLALERYGSLDELEAFWHSPKYRDARPNRVGIYDMHFIVAVIGDGSGAPPVGGAYVVACVPEVVDRPGATRLATAVSDAVNVFEGSWPFDGHVLIEWYPSIVDAEDAWATTRDRGTAIVVPGVPAGPPGTERNQREETG